MLTERVYTYYCLPIRNDACTFEVDNMLVIDSNMQLQ